MVVLSQDGWSNVHNEPIIGTCLHLPRKSIFFEATDVGAHVKNADYCFELAKSSIVAGDISI